MIESTTTSSMSVSPRSARCGSRRRSTARAPPAGPGSTDSPVLRSDCPESIPIFPGYAQNPRSQASVRSSPHRPPAFVGIPNQAPPRPPGEQPAEDPALLLALAGAVDLRPDAPPALAATADAALAKDPSARPGDGAALMAALAGGGVAFAADPDVT